jgi:hypothetical protein
MRATFAYHLSIHRKADASMSMPPPQGEKVWKNIATFGEKL